MAVVASAQFLISMTDLKLHLDIGTTGQDGWLDKALASTTKRIETYCNRHFASAGYTEYADGVNKGFLHVKNPPIINVSALNSDVNRDFGSATEYATNAYITYDDDGRIELLSIADVTSSSLSPVVFPSGQQNIKIVYTGGYAAIPEDVRLGCAEWIGRIYKRRTRKRWNIEGAAKGDKTISYETFGAMPLEVKDFIHPYRLIPAGRSRRLR